LVVVVAFLGLVAGGWVSAFGDTAPEAQEIDRVTPGFSPRPVDESQLIAPQLLAARLKEFRGTGLLVYVWSHPSVVQRHWLKTHILPLAAKYNVNGLWFLSACVVFGPEDLPRARATCERLLGKARWFAPNVFLPASDEVGIALDVDSDPALLLVDARGAVVWKVATVEVNMDLLEPAIRKCLDLPNLR
jgi:hypothetical protein